MHLYQTNNYVITTNYRQVIGCIYQSSSLLLEIASLKEGNYGDSILFWVFVLEDTTDLSDAK